jgi:hypothetical protein
MAAAPRLSQCVGPTPTIACNEADTFPRRHNGWARIARQSAHAIGAIRCRYRTRTNLLSSGRARGSRLVQRQPCAPEQRIRRTLQGTDHRTDPPPLYQPATAARLPHATGALQDVGVVLRAADRHHAPELGELDRADADGQGRRRAHA